MISKNPKSIQMFTEDFIRTYGRIETRTKEIIAEENEAGEVEQIQLVAEDPNVEIGFRIPDGPPPEELRVEGEGAEQIDIEDVSPPPQSLLHYNVRTDWGSCVYGCSVNGKFSNRSPNNSRRHSRRRSSMQSTRS